MQHGAGMQASECFASMPQYERFCHHWRKGGGINIIVTYPMVQMQCGSGLHGEIFSSTWSCRVWVVVESRRVFVAAPSLRRLVLLIGYTHRALFERQRYGFWLVLKLV